MDESGDLHPLGLAVPPDSFSCLKEVLDLRDAGLSGPGVSSELAGTASG